MGDDRVRRRTVVETGKLPELPPVVVETEPTKSPEELGSKTRQAAKKNAGVVSSVEDAGEGKVVRSLVVASSDALTALAAAGISEELAGAGASRTTGLGITVPLMKPRKKLGVTLEEYARVPLSGEIRAKLAKMKVAVSADHGAYGRAEQTAELLRGLGVGEVFVFAPKEPERMDYGVSTSSAMKMLEAGEVDRVISFCGNGLGALDVANVFAELAPKTKPPVYGDNFWSVVDGQRGKDPANVLCLGARLLNVPNDPLAAFVKAFFDTPANVDALRSGAGAAEHGVSSNLIDPKPGRVEVRTLKPGYPFAGTTIAEQSELDAAAKKRIAKLDVRIYYDRASPLVKKQADALKKYLPDNVELLPWDGKMPAAGKNGRIFLLTEDGSGFSSPRTWGFYQPDDVALGRVQKAEHWRQVESFARDSAPGALFLDVPCKSLADSVTGGEGFDVLKLMAKVFLVTEPGDAAKHKALYGEAITYAIDAARGFSAV